MTMTPDSTPQQPESTPLTPRWGLHYPVPVAATAVWGGRGIDDGGSLGTLHNRQDAQGHNDRDVDTLLTALDANPVWAHAAFAAAKHQGLIAGNSRAVVVLHEEYTPDPQRPDPGKITVIASCNQSHGYVYLCAFFVPGGVTPEPLIPEPRVVLPLSVGTVSERSSLALSQIDSGRVYLGGGLSAGVRFCIDQGWARWTGGDKQPLSPLDSLTLTPLGKRALATPLKRDNNKGRRN